MSGSVGTHWITPSWLDKLNLMAIFAVIPTPNPNGAHLGPAIVAKFADANYPMDGDHGWLVAADMTAKSLSDVLGITDGSNGSALVFEIASYFGRANPNIWSWIKLHWETGRNA